MNSDKISDLYSAGDISGFAYLACIEKGIYTVQDAVTMGVFNEPCPSWAKEIESFVEKPKCDTSLSDYPSNEHQWEDLWKEIKEVYAIHERFLDKRTKSALDRLKTCYSTFEAFFHELFIEDSDLWGRFVSLRSVGRASFNRARVFVDALGQELVTRGISWQSLWDTYTDGHELVQDLNIDLDKIIRDVIRTELSKLSTRSNNALILLFHECGDSYTSFYHTLTSKGFDVWKMRNVGRKSAPEVFNFVIRIQVKVREATKTKRVAEGIGSFQDHSAVSEISLSGGSAVDYDSFRAYFEAKMHDLSTRSFNAINSLYIKCGNSVSVFLEQVSSPEFQVTSLPAVGKKSAKEISSWINGIQDLLSAESNKVKDIKRSAIINHYAILGLKGDADRIEEISASLGHFALFLAISQYIEQLNERERSIIKGQLRIFNGQRLKDRKSHANSLGITPERLRQIRKAQLQKLAQYIQWLGQFKNDYSSYVYKRDRISEINNEEHTCFNDNFINWTISIVWPEEYQLFGDIEIAFENPYGYELNLALVPSSLAKIFDFYGLIRYFKELSEQRRADAQVIPIRDVALQFFKKRIYYESLEEIEKECRSIAYRVYGFRILNDSIYVEKNAIRNNSEWAELIIREVGHPMTADAIYEELEKRNPGKSKSAASLSCAVRNNPNLVSLGKSSTYGLKEWTTGQHRGGTIREFATEYLLSLPMPVAPLEEIGKYVRQFRPSSSDKSIHANLLLEQSGAFSLFYDSRENRFIGLRNYDYGGVYRMFDPAHDSKRDFKTSCTLIEQFVAKNGRFPFHNEEDEEELRLWRFWGVQQSKLRRGKLQDEEAKIIASMAERLSMYRTNKGDYQWLNNYNQVKELILNGPGITAIPIELQQWLNKQRRAYKYDKMPKERVSMFKDLIEFAQNGAKEF